MDNKKLAELLFPDITKSCEEYEKEYPKRDLPEGACVTRIAPSPTGFMHIGNFMQAVTNYVIAKQSNGVFFLRNEDTDKAREVEGSMELIIKILNYYGLTPDEYQVGEKLVGNYGPYVQSERKDIYHAYAKHLVSLGLAYPCFCRSEDLDETRKIQELKYI